MTSSDCIAPEQVATGYPCHQVEERTRSVWYAVAALGLGGFVVVTAEFLPASVLSLIAADLGISEGLAGQAVTATAIMGIFAAPTLAALVPTLDRRGLLAALSGLALVSNVVVALTPTFPLLVASRLLLGVAIAGFWSMSLAAVCPARAAGPTGSRDDRGQHGCLPGDGGRGAPRVLRRRRARLAAGVLDGRRAAAVAVVLQLAWLPSIAPSGSPAPAPSRRPPDPGAVLLGLASIGLIAAGHFAAFTYVRRRADLVPGLGSAGLATLLMVFGVAAFVGNLVAGPLADARLRTALLLAPVLIGAATVGFALLSEHFGTVLAAVAAWGVGFGGIPTLAQTWVARVEPARPRGR